MTRSSQQAIDRAAELANAGDVEAAEAVLRAALQRRPEATDVRRELAMLYHAAAWPYAEAFQWEQLLNYAPDDAMARRELARLAPVIETIREAGASNPPEIKLGVRRRLVVISLEGVLGPCREGSGLDTHLAHQNVHVERLLAAGLRHFAVDMSRVMFVSSYFLGVLVMWARTILRTGGRICACGLRPEIRRVFRASRLNRIVPCYRNLEQASHILANHEVAFA